MPGTANLHRLVAVERLMGRARLAGAAIIFIQFGLFSDYRPGVRPAALLLGLSFLGLGVWTLRRLPAATDPGLTRQLAVTFALDLALIVTFELLLAYEVSATNKLLLVIMVIEGAMKFAEAGAFVILPVTVVEELGAAWMRSSVYGEDVFWQETSALILVTGLVVVFAGRLARLGVDALAQAEAQTQVAEAAEAHTNGVYEALRAGIEGLGTDAIERLLATIASRTRADEVLLLVAEGDGPAETVAQVGGSEADPDEPPSSVDDLETLRDRDDVVMLDVPSIDAEHEAWLIVRGSGLGAVDAMVDQVGLVLRASWALEREARTVARLRDLERVRSDFVTMASHELRTPLSNISAVVATLPRLDELPHMSMEHLLGILTRNVARLERLVTEVATITAIDANEFAVEATPTSLRPLIETVRAEFEFDLRGSADVAVLGDEQALLVVLRHVVSNAVEHGRPPVEIDVTPRDGQVMVRIRDHGPGVPDDQRDLIFERFHLSHSLLSHQRGTGLGLPIARELLAMLGGDLRLEDPQPEVGAAFVLRLPLARAEVAERR